MSGTPSTPTAWQRYEAYKSSGVQWLGDVPEHWGVKRLKFSMNLQSDKADSTGKLLIALENIEGFTGNYIETDAVYEGDAVSFEQGDVLFGKLRPYLSKVFMANTGGVAFGDILVYRVNGLIKPKYAYRVLSSQEFIKIVDSSTYGTKMPRVAPEFLGNMGFPMPPACEQTAIVEFLDQETARIDELIAQKLRFIALLREKRQAVITHAVTKGLDPNAPMKPSGVEWLGDVPVHWSVKPIKHIVSTPVTDGPHETPEILGDGIPFLSAESVKDLKLDFEKKRGFISEAEHRRFSKKYCPQYGDIFMVKSGATTGNIAIVETNEVFNIWSPLAAIRVKPKEINRYFVFYFMQSNCFKQAVELGWNYGTQQNIGMGVIENLVITVSDIFEQTAIVEFLDQETARIDAIIRETERSIELLKEHRSALITAAVTGKIKVA